MSTTTHELVEVHNEPSKATWTCSCGRGGTIRRSYTSQNLEPKVRAAHAAHAERAAAAEAERSGEPREGKCTQ